MAHCRHKDATLCTHTCLLSFGPDDPEHLETFVAYQCDDCGMVLRRDPSEDDLKLDRGLLPNIDEGMWDQAVAAATIRMHKDTSESTYQTMQFFAKAIRR